MTRMFHEVDVRIGLYGSRLPFKPLRTLGPPLQRRNVVQLNRTKQAELIAAAVDDLTGSGRQVRRTGATHGTTACR